MFTVIIKKCYKIFFGMPYLFYVILTEAGLFMSGGRRVSSQIPLLSFMNKPISSMIPFKEPGANASRNACHELA